MSALLVFLLVLLGCLAAGVYLLVRSRGPADSYPRCGHCGYNLTGAVSNRCSECGRLFIEAGVIVRPKRRSKGTLAVGLVLIILPLVFSFFAAVAAGLMSAQADRAKALAIAAQQRAFAAQAKAQALQQALEAAQQAPPMPNAGAAPVGSSRTNPASQPTGETGAPAPEP